MSRYHWTICPQCAGAVPPECLQGKDSELADGDCEGARNEDDREMCGAFGPYSDYSEGKECDVGLED